MRIHNNQPVQRSGSLPASVAAMHKPKPVGVTAPSLRPAPNGQFYNQQGKLVNKHNQLVNVKGQRVNDAGQQINAKGKAINDKGQLINAQNQAINTQGKPVDDKGRLIDQQGRLVNSAGRIIDDKGHYIDKDKKLVNREGFLVDKLGRPLDKDGAVARDKASAAMGNNEPHASLIAPALKTKIKGWQGKAMPPATPPKLSIAEVATRLADADKLVKSGVISSSPGAAQIARDAAIGAAVTGFISAPINVASYSGSVAAGESIKASYLPSPLAPPTPIAKSTVERPAGSPAEPSAATQSAEDVAAQVLYPRINDAQVSAYAMANLSMALNFGETREGFVPGQDWSNDPVERMAQIEHLLDFAEEHTSPLAKANEIFFQPYLREQKADEGVAGLEVRVDTLERRLAAIDKAQRLIEGKLKNESQEKAPSHVTV